MSHAGLPLTLPQAGLDTWLPYVLLPAVEPNPVLSEVLANDSCCSGFQLKKKMQDPLRGKAPFSAGKAFPAMAHHHHPFRGRDRLAGNRSLKPRQEGSQAVAGSAPSLVSPHRVRPTLPTPTAEPDTRVKGQNLRGDLAG